MMPKITLWTSSHKPKLVYFEQQRRVCFAHQYSITRQQEQLTDPWYVASLTRSNIQNTINTEVVARLRVRATIAVFVLSPFLCEHIVFSRYLSSVVFLIPCECAFSVVTQPPSIYPIKRREENVSRRSNVSAAWFILLLLVALMFISVNYKKGACLHIFHGSVPLLSALSMLRRCSVWVESECFTKDTKKK